ncbi:hypothetical protein [Roseibium sp. TrichSKD4]|uniref:hypothetical protein n=1 Tax=Roseibium sp. TrichSKD4 TaxID=744980 RepID=UPI000590AA94|nr:hypothetical protein [Roseibium sp. TrichSKD4]
MKGEYVTEVEELQARLKPFLPTERPEPACWISTPDGDEGNEWCGTCGYYKVRNLRRRDRRRQGDYFLDGGWRAECDHFPCCAGCGVELDIIPTDYCIEELICNFERSGFYQDSQATAFEIDEILEIVNYRYDDNQAKEERRRAAVKIAARFLSSLSEVAA